jgi:N,N-dimethylformamidase beta subunit-like, C-terminal/Concanavalin A-like lectin/glucanases superfamily/PKD domain
MCEKRDEIPKVDVCAARCFTMLSHNAAASLIAALCCALFVAPAGAAVSCPNANPIVNENNCQGAGTSANQMANYSEGLGGFSTQTSYNLGESVALKIGTNEPSFPGTSVSIAVYRMGYYGGEGARLISAAGSKSVKVNNSFTCNPANATTGELSCSNWAVTYTIPGSTLPVSGVYEAVFTDLADGGAQNYVEFVVRNDARASEVLDVLPASTYEAYNTWGCKSLYYDSCGGANTISGDGRAVAVSYERPLAEGEEQRNKFFGPDYDTVEWLEEQGYDVTYTDDLQLDRNPSALLDHKAIVVSGHSEYWSHAAFANMLAAREHGVSILSLSANTAYWQTRFENNYRTLVCYKTVQGSADGNPAGTPNDPASIGAHGEFLPQLATTTRRDPGAPAGNPDAPPEGRVGVNQPENELFGVLYVGDNEEREWGLTVPAGNVGGEYEGDRVWRGAGLPSNSQVTIDSDLVGWEWDQIPSPTSPLYAHAAAVEPEGVKRVSATNTSDPESTWLQDYGRERLAEPPFGQPDTVSAVEYRAASGAYVFSSGTMQWAYGFDVDPAIDQATYNLLAEMGAQPATPEAGIVLESQTAPKLPWAAFKAAPSTVLVGQQVKLDASGTYDPDATISTHYWDLEGAGFTVNTGAGATLTHSFSEPGVYSIVLKVVDSKGQEDETTRTVTVKNSIVPALSAATNPAALGQSVTVSAAGSTDVSGQISDYRWDLTGKGEYTTDTGSTPSVTTSFATAGAHTVGVRESDAAGNTATATIVVNTVASGISNYEASILATPGLLHYYELGESSGPTVHDSKGTANGTLSGATYGVSGAVNGDPNTAVSFPGAGDPDEGEAGSYGTVPLNLSTQSAVTVEFWLKWNAYGDNDALAMEFTPNSNENSGGFLIDPNAPEFGGMFGVGIGDGAARNSIYFARPSAGVWHHYAFVLDPTQPAASEIVPYVDGQPVAVTQEGKGTGAGAFANSTLYLLSRGAKTLFGSGSLDDLAIYGGDLSAARIAEHFQDNGTDPRPTASFAPSPALPRPGQTVKLNAAASSYSKGSIKKYEWDLNGDGTYETTTTTPTVTTSYATAQTVNVGLRVTDSNGGWEYITQPVRVGEFPPEARLSVAPNPVITGQGATLNASGSTDQGLIKEYRWDLTGKGEYITSTGSTPTLKTSFATVGAHTVGVEVIDERGLTATTTATVTVLEEGVSDYADAVLDTPGLLHYYPLGEAAGPTIHDGKGTTNGTIAGGTFGLEGAVLGEANTALGFNGTSDSGAIANTNLSGTSQVTVEFWLKWERYANNDALALELTPNFNEVPGGFLVDPNAPEYGGTFGVGIGMNNTRNSIFFTRPSAGVWHHYAFVLNGTAPTGSEITPYVDGLPVAFQTESSGTGAGAFANSTLYLMSRDGSALFGAGTLDDLALYGTDLNAATVYQHYNSHGTTKPPSTVLKAPSTATPGQSVTLDASASTDPDAKIVDYQWELNENGSYETDTGTTPTLKTSFAKAGTHTVAVRAIDSLGASATATATITVRNETYSAAILATPGLVHYYRLDEAAGPTIHDGKGSSGGTVSGGSFGLEGAIAGEADTALGFNGTSDSGAIPLNLSETSQLSVEFWLKWNSYANNDSLAMEFTPNFNENSGGLLIDPDAPELGGSFGVGIGTGASRNSIYFPRPTAGVWHHYVFVLNSTAAAGAQITPYVDGQPVTFTQGATGTGAGPFANSTLYLMSRDGSALFGAGTLDELAIYNTSLSAATVAAHYADGTL